MTFPIQHFVGNTECGGSNQVAVALVEIPFVNINGGGKNGVLTLHKHRANYGPGVSLYLLREDTGHP